jgi:hypothetical protein
MPDPHLLAGEGPRGARGDIGRGAGVRLAYLQQVGPIDGTRRDPRARGWDRELACL